MKLLKTLVLVTTLALAGCVTVENGKVVTTDPKVQAVINKVAAGCSFYVLGSSVLALLNKKPGAAVDTLASLICNAVSNVPLSDGPRAPVVKVNGVRIEGQYASGRRL